MKKSSRSYEPMAATRDPLTGRWQGVGAPRRQMMGLFPGVEQYRQRRWLASYLITGRLRETARISGLAFSNHYHWLDKHPEYGKAFELAKRIVIENVEDEVYRRAVCGYPKPVIYKGVITDTYLEYSDALLQFWLKGNCPEKYRDSLIGLTANAPAGITINLIGGQAEGPASKQALEAPDVALFHNDTSTEKSNTYDAS